MADESYFIYKDTINSPGWIGEKTRFTSDVKILRPDDGFRNLYSIAMYFNTYQNSINNSSIHKFTIENKETIRDDTGNFKSLVEFNMINDPKALNDAKEINEQIKLIKPLVGHIQNVYSEELERIRVKDPRFANHYRTSEFYNQFYKFFTEMCKKMRLRDIYAFGIITDKSVNALSIKKECGSSNIYVKSNLFALLNRTVAMNVRFHGVQVFKIDKSVLGVKDDGAGSEGNSEQVSDATA